MLDHELCELACNFFAVVFACLWTELHFGHLCLFLVHTTAGRDACGMRTLMDLLFSHLRAVQQTSLLLAFRKGTVFDARWAAYRTTYRIMLYMA